MKYSFANYPGNPNGSGYNTAAICSVDGRHLAMMPPLERAIYPMANGDTTLLNEKQIRSHRGLKPL